MTANLCGVNDKADTIQGVCHLIEQGRPSDALECLEARYPFRPRREKRLSISKAASLKIFIRDRFVDRYSRGRLIFAGSLKVITSVFPDRFPYHPHGRMDAAHMAYWELLPSIDHIQPIALGGHHHQENMVTTSMRLNAIKANWTLEEIGWTLYPLEEATDWDGLTGWFRRMVSRHPNLLEDQYIRGWATALDSVVPIREG